MSQFKWHKIANLPKKDGLYLVCAPSADPKMPFRHVAWFEPGQGFAGIVPQWIKALTHWGEFPKAPKFKHRDA